MHKAGFLLVDEIPQTNRGGAGVDVEKFTESFAFFLGFFQSW
jgi:hypothetical protein